MRKHISLARQDSTPVIEETSAFMEQRKQTETKKRLLDAFVTHFIVPNRDLMDLTSAETPINERFFSVLAEAKQVYHDCEVLLGGENERLGQEIMEQTSRNLNSAYQKLYRWVQKEFKSLNLEDPRISGSIRRALRVLAERPSLFHSCLDFFAEARDYILSEAFHYALTEAASEMGSDRKIKPIEFSAHDPLRYIGDMLAWIHSTTVSEREALESLFIAEGEEIAKGIKAGLSSEPWSRVDDDEAREVGEASFDGHKALSDLVNRDLARVSQDLRQRVELVIQGHDDPVTCYKVVNLLSFYRATFSKLVGPQSTLADLMQFLERFTFEHFEILIKDQLNALSGDRSTVFQLPEDLSAPRFLLDALEELTSLMKAHAASFGEEDDDAIGFGGGGSNNKDGNRFTPILRVVLDPFLELATSASEQLQQDATARTIYLTNVLLTTQSTVSQFPFASATHLKPISTSLTGLRVDLVKVQHEYFLRTSGLQGLLTALDSFSKNDSKSPQTTADTATDSKPSGYCDSPGVPTRSPKCDESAA